MAYTRTSPEVTGIKWGSASALDILNKLWLMGFSPTELQGALATTATGTNDPADIVARLLNRGFSVDVIKGAVATPNTAFGTTQLPFSYDSQRSGVLVPRTTSWAPGSSPTAADPRFMPASTAMSGGPVPPGALTQARVATTSTGMTAPTNPAAAVTQPRPPAPHRMPTTEAEIQAYIAANFGSMGWAKAIPELDELLKRGAREEWTAEQWRARLQSTHWYQNTNAKARAWTEIKGSQPEEAKRMLESSRLRVKNAAHKMGVVLTDEKLNEIAENIHRFGWEDDAPLNAALAAEAQFGPNLQGDIGQYYSTVKGYGRDFFQNISDQDAFNLARDWAGGAVDEDNIFTNFKETAKGLLPSLALQIDAGMKPRQLLAPHIGQIAQLLEIGTEEVDLLNDARFNTVLQVPDDKLGSRIMTLSEVSKHTKSLDDYWTTHNAENETSSYFSQISKAFGI